MDMFFFKKTLAALFELFLISESKSDFRLIMTLLVKNEDDILEENLIFHKSMGVDGFIITDNNSSDRTPEIIQKYKEKGWILEVINEKATNYEQKKWVDRMIWKAKVDYKADWIINADADELWYSPLGSIKTELVSTRANVLDCEMICVYPEEGKPFWQWDQTIEPVIDYKRYNLSLHSVFTRQNKKVLHRATGYLQISMGNHKVAMFPKRKAVSSISIYHYNFRSKQHFLNKMINGGKQLEQNPQKHGGRHWRYFYQLYKDGLLDAEYDKVIGTTSYNQLKQDGFIRTDITIPNIFDSYKTIFNNIS